MKEEKMLNGNEGEIWLRRLQCIYLFRAEFKGGSRFQQDLERKETRVWQREWSRRTKDERKRLEKLL